MSERTVSIHIPEIIADREALLMPDKEFMQEFGINTRGDVVITPSNPFISLGSFEGERHTEDHLLSEKPFTANTEITSQLIQDGIDIPAFSRYSQAAAVVDVIGSGLYPKRNLHYLQRYLLAKELYDTYYEDRLCGNDLHRYRENPEQIAENIEHFSQQFPELATHLGLDQQRMELMLIETIFLENAILTGNTKQASLIVGENPRTLTVLLGSKCAEIMSGIKPDSFGMQYFTALMARSNEFAPHEHDITDSGVRNEFGNILGLAMDLHTAQTFPRSFALADWVQAHKTGEEDYFWRTFFAGNSPTAIGFLNLNTIPKRRVTDPDLERGIKSLTGTIRKATRPYIEELYPEWKNRSSRTMTALMTFPEALKGFSGLEAVLANYIKEEDDELLAKVLQGMIDIGDDLRMRYSPSDETFDEIVHEMSEKTDVSIDLVADVYNENGNKVEIEKPSFRELFIDGSPNENYRKIRSQLEAKAGEGGKVYLAVRYKRVINDNNLTISLHLTPKDEEVQLGNWETRPLYANQ